VDRLLITVYLHLIDKPNNEGEIMGLLEKLAMRPGDYFKTETGVLYSWVDETEILGLIKDEKSNQFYIYHSMKSFSIYQDLIG
jgi:hypothetical protein